MPTVKAAWRALLKADQRRLNAPETASPERKARLQMESDRALQDFKESLQRVEQASRYQR